MKTEFYGDISYISLRFETVIRFKGKLEISKRHTWDQKAETKNCLVINFVEL